MQAAPLVIVGGNGTWPGGAVEALLRGRGYRLRSVAEVNELVNLIHTEHPDLIIIAPGLRGADKVGLCRALRQRRWLATTPVFVLCSGSRAEEVAALEAGASDAVKCPPDPELFVARVRNAVDTKREADHAIQRGLIDPLTGCYNREGLITRLREEILYARRHKEPLACLVVALDPLADVIHSVGDPEASESAFRTAADVLRQGCRRSDILAHHTELDFSIVAPATTRTGCRKLVARLTRAFEDCPVRTRANGTARPFRPVVGITVHTSWQGREETPQALIGEASKALVMARAWGSGYRIFAQGSSGGSERDSPPVTLDSG